VSKFKVTFEGHGQIEEVPDDYEPKEDEELVDTHEEGERVLILSMLSGLLP